MWSILLAVFGGLYWGVRFSNDRSKSKSAERRISQSIARGEMWNQSVLDNKLNAKLRDLVETEHGFETLKTRAESVIRKLPGMEYANLNGRYDNASKHTAIFIEAIRHGKVPHGDEFTIPEYYLWKCTDFEFSKKAKIAFLCWIEDSLQAAGCDAHIYLDAKYSNGFVWGSWLVSYENALSIRDEDIQYEMPGEPDEVVEERNAPRIQEKRQKERYKNWEYSVNGGEMQQFLELEFDKDRWLGIMQSTLDFLRTLPGLEYADYWLSNPAFHNSCRDLIFLIEMVKRGKLPKSCYIGIPDDILHNTLDLYIQRKTKIAFAQWVENTLIKNGVTGAELYYRACFRPRFVFSSSLIHSNEAIKITDPNLPFIMDGESEKLIAARNEQIIQQKIKS